MKRLYLLFYISILTQFSPQECLAALMVKESVNLEHVSTVSIRKQQNRRVIYKKKQKRKKGFRKKWRRFWKKLKVKFKSIGKNRKQQKAAEDYREIEPFSLLSFIFTLILFLAVFVLVTEIAVACFFLSPILAIVGLKRIKKNPDRFIGKVFAIVSLCVFFLILVGMGLLLLALANTQ